MTVHLVTSVVVCCLAEMEFRMTVHLVTSVVVCCFAEREFRMIVHLVTSFCNLAWCYIY